MYSVEFTLFWTWNSEIVIACNINHTKTIRKDDNIFSYNLRRSNCGFLTVSEKFNDYAKLLERQFLAQNIRVTTDLRNKKIGAKIREGRLDLVPYLAVVGAKEEESNTVALRSRKNGELGEINVGEVVEKLAEEIRTKSL